APAASAPASAVAISNSAAVAAMIVLISISGIQRPNFILYLALADNLLHMARPTRQRCCADCTAWAPKDPPPRGNYASPEIFLRNFPARIRFSRLIFTRPRVRSLIAPRPNISFIGVQ